MNIQELLESGRNVSITLQLSDLVELIDLAIIKAKEEFETKKKETYLTTDKASEALGVSRVTLWRWDKDNYLNAIEIGGKRRYRLSDVNKILEGM